MANWWEANSLTINTGAIDSGALTDTYVIDGTDLVLGEVTGDPGFDYEIDFAGIPGDLVSFRFIMYGYYSGNAAHTTLVQAWNYTTSAWVLLGNLPDESGDQSYIFPTIPTADYVSGGAAIFRLYHPQSGVGSHDLNIDMLLIENMGVDVTTAVPTTVPPTTVPPTTLPPTTLIVTTIAPTTLIVTTLPPTTVPPTTVIPPTTPVPTTPPPRTRENDVLFNCRANNYAGVLIMDMDIDQSYSLSASYGLAELELSMDMEISGTTPLSGLYSMSELELAMDMVLSGWGVANDSRKNWVGWSKIGNVSFVLDRVNDAGFRPMSWSGYVYQTLQLDKNVVIYGSGGATLAHPVSKPLATFGFKDLPIKGIKNKTAVAGDQFVHYCVDILGCLIKVTTEGVARLGYEEFLLPMINPVLTWDAADQRLHISDVTGGFVYNDSILTGGYAKLTGLYRIKDVLVAVSPDNVETDPVAICTDSFDFERRGLKSIESIQTDAISEVPLLMAIDYRYNKKEEFRTTEYTPLNNEGVAHIRTAGVEFRIRLKGLDGGTFNLSYFSIQFKFIDQRFTRDPKGPLDVY